MRVLLGPTNFANQPMLLARALQAGGVQARHVLYAWGGRLAFGYGHDRVIHLDRTNWLPKQLSLLVELVEDPPDVVHLWHRSLLYPPGGYSFWSGLDLPFLKAAGTRIVYRFTGYDLRRPSLDVAVNPYSPFRRGFDPPTDEETQQRYLDHLRQWVDAFVVQDPEMHAFLPEAEIIPRGIDLDEFPYAGVSAGGRPLVVHAPSSKSLKGSEHVLEAIESLRRRGIECDFQLLEGLSHRDAVGWYRRADVIVDQLLIGWYGVVALEGMALGKPVVAYVRPDLAERLGQPLPVVSATPDDLADRLEPLLADARLRRELGERGRAFVEGVHDIRQVAATTERLYERVLRERRAPDPAPRYLTALAHEPMEMMMLAARRDRGSRPVPRLWDAGRAQAVLRLASRDPAAALRVARIRLKGQLARRRRRDGGRLPSRPAGLWRDRGDQARRIRPDA
jgi:glycosyltransferase involved in cell wall biosynthesis